MIPRIAIGYVLALLTVFVPAQGSKSDRIRVRDWDAIPVSTLQAKVAEACATLSESVSELKFVVTPFQGNAAKQNPWRIETFVQRLVRRELKVLGCDVVDSTPFLDDVRQRLRKTKKLKGKAVDGPLPKLKFTNKMIGRAAQTSGAEFVVVGLCKFGSKKSKITLRIYRGSPCRRLASAVFSIATRELGLERNTPATNRKVIAWVEQNIGKKIDRGECWDLANRAFATLGIRRPGGAIVWGELVPPGAAILPGDIIQWDRKETGGRHHTVVVYDVPRPGQVKVLHQNWARGAERGRVVGPGSFGVADLTKARVYRPIVPE